MDNPWQVAAPFAHRDAVMIPEVCGRGWWGSLEGVVNAIPCEDCREHGQMLLSGMHDLVNQHLGKPVHDAENFRKVAGYYAEALDGRQNFNQESNGWQVSDEDGDDADLEQDGLPAPFGWPGGKSRLKKQIIALMPTHKTYVEPFAGAASVFWAKQPSEVEVLNDKDADLIRFYQQLPTLKACDIAGLGGTDDGFDRLLNNRGNLSACEFLANVNCSFSNNRVDPALIGRCTNSAPAFHLRLSRYRDRIKEVKLHNEDWEATVRRYDAADTVFYFDPPYTAATNQYDHADEQLTQLSQVLPTLKGKWLLSENDDPRVRQAFQGFSQLTVQSHYSMAATTNTQLGKQLLIANFPLEVTQAQRLPSCGPSQQAQVESCIQDLKDDTNVNPWAVCQASIGCALPSMDPVNLERMKLDGELITIIEDHQMAEDIKEALATSSSRRPN